MEYVSNNINSLFNFGFVNNDSCLREVCKSKSRMLGYGDGYRVVLYIRLSVEDGDLIDEKDISRSIKNQLLLLLDSVYAS